MRIRKKEWARPELAACNYYIDEPETEKGSWAQHFGAKRPMHLDLGCGKCVFLAEIAEKNRNINYIGIDISKDMLGVGRRNIAAEFGERLPDNVLLFSYNIEKLGAVFAEEEKFARIYINFCNPWPKARAHKKRLTHTAQLNLYKNFLQPDGEIWFKTDNDDLYMASLRYFKEAGMHIYYHTKNLHADKDMENYITEHEAMFTSEGIKIKAIRARL